MERRQSVSELLVRVLLGDSVEEGTWRKQSVVTRLQKSQGKGRRCGCYGTCSAEPQDNPEAMESWWSIERRGSLQETGIRRQLSYVEQDHRRMKRSDAIGVEGIRMEADIRLSNLLRKT